VFVNEPSVEDTISILRGIKERYQVHHNVEITDPALVAAAVLSNRYISDRQLPDKAIDLIDESAARLRMQLESSPEEIDGLERRKLQLEIERQALSKEKDDDSMRRLEVLDIELRSVTEKVSGLRGEWESERGELIKLKDAREKLDVVRTQIEKAEREYDLSKAAELKYGTLPALEKEVLEFERSLKNAKFASQQVTDDDIAEIVSRWTGIPVSKLLEGEREKLLRLEGELHKRVIGQEEAIRAVSDAIRRSRAGLSDPKRPIGSFMFLGPTGVGKTELAKALAGFLFDTEDAMIRIDMSEYMEKHSVSRLIGAPPGYVGFEEGGQLTEAIRRRPYAVILFDEIEKAHPDVFNVLLQVLDDGRLTDGQGRTVDFRNTVIVMTSNIGSPIILEAARGGGITSGVREDVQKLLQSHFRPEFLNRVDEIVIFDALSVHQMRDIVDIQLSGLRSRLHERRVSLELTDAAKDHLASVGYDPAFGARPLKRAIGRELETPLAKKILAGEVPESSIINVDFVDGRLEFGLRLSN
jgi:ATP-dependent Clp protease ATP-binding subunit ClpB